jgi:excisionase family DNA binding protein
MTPLLRVNEVAETLAISRRSVYLLVGSGDLPAIRVGERLRFRPSDIDAYLEARKVAAG